MDITTQDRPISGLSTDEHAALLADMVPQLVDRLPAPLGDDAHRIARDALGRTWSPHLWQQQWLAADERWVAQQADELAEQFRVEGERCYRAAGALATKRRNLVG